MVEPPENAADMPRADLDDPLFAAVLLNLVRGIGPRLHRALLDRFGEASAALRASLADLQTVPGIGPKVSQAVFAARAALHEAAADEIRRCRAADVRLVLLGSPEYPANLARICDPPPVLYVRGTLEPGDGLAVALVGSRQATLYGRQQAQKLAGALARAGVTVVSGLARGIDASAHQGALEAGGRTVAVLATGLSTIYPPEHLELAGEIARHGAVVSESPLDQAAVPGLFPQRNRIVSGLSLGTVIVEASRTSGALHTARHAMEQGRDVFAVPGRIDSPGSVGCHDLIRDGAALVRDVDDVLESLGPLAAPVARSESETVLVPRELNLNDQERRILNLVALEPVHLDEVVSRAEMETQRVLSTVTVLEMKRVLQRLPGGYVVRRT